MTAALPAPLNSVVYRSPPMSSGAASCTCSSAEQAPGQSLFRFLLCNDMLSMCCWYL